MADHRRGGRWSSASFTERAAPPIHHFSDQLALSLQWGFDSGGDHGLQLTEYEQWAKFDRISETAREVWG
jgi:hypothetical protein